MMICHVDYYLGWPVAVINHRQTRTQALPDYPANTTLLGINWHLGKKEPRQLGDGAK